MRVVAKDDSEFTLALSRDEMIALKNALNEVCHGPDAIGEWEFYTRTGVHPADAKALLTELGDAFGQRGIV